MLYSNFQQKFWYTLQSEREELSPARFLIQLMSYRTYSQIQNHQQLPDGLLQEQFHELLLNECVIDSENVLPKPNNLSEELPREIRDELIQVIVDLCFPTKEFYDSIAISVELNISPRFKEDSWNCKTCQERKLDKSRNCPYLDIEEYHEPTYYLDILGERHTVCPMAKQDSKLLQQAFEAYNFRQAGNGMPEAGGVGDQTIFYVIASEYVNRAIKREEARQQEEAYSKHKR